MAASNSFEPYKFVSVLHITSKDDEEGERNAAQLEQVWKEYGFDFEHANEDTWGLKPGNATSRAQTKFGEWLDRVDPQEGNDDGLEDRISDKTLMIVCCFGHGSVQNGRLYLGVDTEFDFSKLQETARNSTSGDVLFVIECCFADFNGTKSVDLENYSEEQFNEDMKCETIAAGTGLVRRNKEGTDFTLRLAENLRTDTGPRTVKERFDAIKGKDGGKFKGMPGKYECQFGKDKPSIVLQPM